MADSHEVQRRDFVNIVLVGIGSVIGLIIGIPAIAYLISPAVKVQEKEAWIPLGPLDGYPLDSPVLFSYTRSKINGWEKTVNSYGAYIWRYGEGDSELRVYSNMCTHLSCRVTWKDETNIYFCPCHDGRFNKEGEVVAGPPPRPLYEYEHKVDEGILFIKHMEA
ncbi:MAG: ubiquinol-cytochrome c reductase iron-sulfur subunit [Anaerolineales bacterium]|jgi:Rieske Fe-S protein